jgi:hypothetical protein
MLRILYSDVAPISEEVLNSLDGEVKTYLGLSISYGPKMTFFKNCGENEELQRFDRNPCKLCRTTKFVCRNICSVWLIPYT